MAQKTFHWEHLAKSGKSEGELDNILEKWLYLLRNLRRLEERPKELQDRVFEMFFRAAEIARLPKEKQQTYRESIMNENDWMNAMAFAEEKGEKKAKLETARNFLKLGVPIDTVMQATGLSEEELSQPNEQ